MYAINKLNFRGDLIICGNPSKENYKELYIKGPRRVFIYGKHRNELLHILKHENILTCVNLDEIFNILKKMSGKSHFLISSVCISKKGNMIWNHTDKAELFMKNLKALLVIYCTKLKNALII